VGVFLSLLVVYDIQLCEIQPIVVPDVVAKSCDQLINFSIRSINSLPSLSEFSICFAHLSAKKNSAWISIGYLYKACLARTKNVSRF